ncbi:MAG TPA: hypothetical protein VK552_00475, partial [Reyranella sp.]|nr:hypothetical protein [Reyranella sp.]
MERHAAGLGCLCFGLLGRSFLLEPGVVPCCRKDLFSGPVKNIEIFRRWLRAWMRRNRVQLALTLRMTVAAV